MQSYRTPNVIEINIDELKKLSSAIQPIELSERLDDILDEISKITDKYNDSTKSNSKNELLKIIISDLESHINQIKSHQKHAADKPSKTIIDGIIETLTNAISTNKQNDSKDSKHTPFDQSKLYQDQQLLEKREISTKFVAMLEKIKNLAKFECVNVYISHGEGNHNGEQDEGTLPGMINFLQTLRDHLNKAGIYAKISIDSGDFGFGGIYHFQEKASYSNYFLIAGTENYLRKHNSKTDMVVCGDLVMIHRKRELSEKLGRPKCVFPITISGSLQSSLPEYFHNYVSEQDWTVSGTYFTHLKRLISVFFGFKKQKQIDALHKIWEDFLSQLDPVTAIRLNPNLLNTGHTLSTDQIPQTSTATETPPLELNTATSATKDVKSTPSNVKDSKTATACASIPSKATTIIELADKPPAYEDVNDSATSTPHTQLNTTAQIVIPNFNGSTPPLSATMQPVYNTVTPIIAYPFQPLIIPPASAAPSLDTKQTIPPSVVNHSMFSQLIATKKYNEIMNKITRPLEEKIKVLDSKDERKIACLEALNTIKQSNQSQLQLQALMNAHNQLYKIESKTSTVFTKSNCIYKLIRHWFFENHSYLKDIYDTKLINHELTLTDKSLHKSISASH